MPQWIKIHMAYTGKQYTVVDCVSENSWFVLTGSQTVARGLQPWADELLPETSQLLYCYAPTNQ